MLNILVVSDEAGRLFELFAKGGYALGSEEPKKDAPQTKTPKEGRYDMALLDLDIEGWRQRLVELRQRMPVVVFSRPDIKAAVEAMRLGAADYIEKPLDGDALALLIEKHKRKILTTKYGFDEIIGVSPPMQEVFGLIKKAALSESNVLITGDSGTGKELVARAIHRWSPRSEGAFITINCSAIPDTLLESELFGFEKGAFTSANYTKKGLMELADGGTVFFDEIGDVSALFQIKILRVLQEGEFMRIGALRQTKVDVRLIAATNKDLKAACQRAAFREDLFYRLNVINIHLPPLRERLSDVPLLVRHFIEKHSAKRKDILIKGASEDALKILLKHDYPGNARELENIVEHAISFANTPEILPMDLPQFLLERPPKEKPPAPKLKEAVDEYEREIIASALNQAGGNISKAAAALGIYRQQLQRKIKEFRLEI